MKLTKKLLCTSLIMVFLVSMVAVNVTSASPETVIYVDPPEVTDLGPGEDFTVTINVTDAPSTYAWEIYLSWDPNLLELVPIWDPHFVWDPDLWQWNGSYTGVREGDFLHRWEWLPIPAPGGTWLKKFDTTLANTPLGEANAEGEIMIVCTLIGELPTGYWASGDGWLCSLNFTVKAEGSTLLNLFDTSLWDHMEAGYPAPTPKSNEDGFFINVDTSHDIRITDVTVFTPEVLGGEVASIDVTVLNEGNMPETVNVTVYANGFPIGTATDIPLAGAGNFEDRSSTFGVAWNTTGFLGIYTISAEAVVAVDDDPGDNTLVDGTVTVSVRNLMVISVVYRSGASGAMLPPATFSGDTLAIFVTVYNTGTRSEVFDVYAYVDMDTDPIGDEIILGPSPGALHPGECNKMPYVFLWDTTGFPLGEYTISAYVPPLPGELSEADNTLVDGAVLVTFPARLFGWKLKVNGKAGKGQGHKSTIGKENSLEAYVKCADGFIYNVTVQAFFVIEDSAGPIGTPIASNIVWLLEPGETTILSATWAADHADIYQITAYLMWHIAPYPPFPPYGFQDGFSKTQTLKVK